MTLEELTKDIGGQLQALRVRMQGTVNQLPDGTTRKWMSYFMEEKGHMIRPTLTFLSYLHFKPEPEVEELETLEKLALCFEFLHTASLIHDDVLDEEELRRGMPTINTRLGNKGAILVGNVFYLEAFRIASELPSLVYFKSMVDTSQNMCFGEVLQLEWADRKLNRDEYLEIIEKKTAKLISMCCREGARLAGASIEQVEHFGRLGRLLGMLYQLRDDSKDQDAHLSSDVDPTALHVEHAQELRRELEAIDRSNPYADLLQSFSALMM